MSDIEKVESTVIDDVRRIRERLDRESNGDIQKHIEQSNRVLEEYREKLNLTVVRLASPPPRRDGTNG